MHIKLLFKIWILFCFCSFAEPVYAKNIIITPKSSKDEVNVVISSHEPILKYNYFNISDENPPKLVIDIAGDWKNEQKPVIRVDNDLVERIRIGEHPDSLRIVLDLKVKTDAVSYNFEKTSNGLLLRMKSIIPNQPKTVVKKEILKQQTAKAYPNKRTVQGQPLTDSESKIAVAQDIKEEQMLSTYYQGVDLFLRKEYQASIERFEYVITHAVSQMLRLKAESWIEEADKKMKESLPKPFSLYAKIGYQYDKVSVPYKTEMEEIDINDHIITGFFSGDYNFINKKDIKLGLGYTHYQSWHSNFKEYDMTDSIFDFHVIYDIYPSVTLGLSYQPSYYWIESRNYLMQNTFKSDLSFKLNLNDRFTTTISYSYSDNHYKDNEINKYQEYLNDGNVEEITANIFYKFNNNIKIFGGIGYEDSSTNYKGYYYDDAYVYNYGWIYPYTELKAKIGSSITLPWKINFDMLGEIDRREYSHISLDRNDTKYSLSLLLSREFFLKWLYITTEYTYINNDSRMFYNGIEKDFFDYKRQIVNISLSAKY